ncbi:MAG: sigma-70 family RNA polymerase sigma factor [Bacteroidota bacterium]|nr:sigma-70 family RNA polymerase sigma factor [Bacteroidota bacterium]MDP4218754.1 sigma-70 family RNA polymerase sigma factor [Bacteroidota bacterium]MDP4245348.1 sigma-70 family RNA polymerase sigma factor [Bacteroidota bacterium]MDP4258490.1 sigma-70 family RNA polymerase sigma factor [Bacteroidota bacterium]
MTAQREIPQLVDNLFRHEAGKLISVLTKVFGADHMELAEDVVQEALAEALEHWQYRGIPERPAAWLYRVAKNKALNIVNREGYHRRYASEVAHFLRSEPATEPAPYPLFSEEEIQDDQLRMIFTCCHPALSPDSQIALALKTLCGFSIPEIAKAYLTTEENIHKRLVRARQSIRDAKIPFEVPSGQDLEKRLHAVMETVYLLFNEGYSASKGDEIIRYELCEEAIRLARIIVDDKTIRRKETVHALLALMFINASRFRARQDEAGNLLTLAEQDRSLWDKQLLGTGLGHLSMATQNESISIYHILAAISAQYSIAPSYEATDWQSILSLYDSLIRLDDSPLIWLNRAIVVSKVSGARQGLAELEKISSHPAFTSYHLFYSTQAEFYIQDGDLERAVAALETAIRLASVPSEISLLEKKLKML